MIDTINGAKISAILYIIAKIAKANTLKPYESFYHLLAEITKYMEDKTNRF
jgi:transposase